MNELHVVGAAILDGARCLATRRSAAMSMPLKWEFPGGKVEPGEAPAAALAREIAEELELVIEVDRHLATGFGTSGTRTVRLEVYLARCTGGDLVLHEHDEAGWFTADELARLDWAAADLPAVEALVAHLRR